MSAFDLSKSQVAICCQCGQWFKAVGFFVMHAKTCQKFKAAIKEDPALIHVYEELLHLREGALA